MMEENQIDNEQIGRTKSEGAMKTIGEVAKSLQLPPHVLRFWESKFNQIKPVKRRGGHRYYRPEDVEIIKQIKSLLYDRGYTIKGAQKHLKMAKNKDVVSGYGDETQESSLEFADHRNQLNISAAEINQHSGLQNMLKELIEVKAILSS